MRLLQYYNPLQIISTHILLHKNRQHKAHGHAISYGDLRAICDVDNVAFTLIGLLPAFREGSHLNYHASLG